MKRFLRKMVAISTALMLTLGYTPPITNFPTAELKAATSSDILTSASRWNGEMVEFENGSGTLDDPFLIESAQQLAFFVHVINDPSLNAFYSNKSYKLTTDILINKNVLKDDGSLNGNPTYKWEPIGSDTTHPFKGNFDGGGHTISGIYQPMNDCIYGGFIGYWGSTQSDHITNPVIKNLNIKDSCFCASNGDKIGCIVSDMDHYYLHCSTFGKIDNCNVEASVISKNRSGNESNTTPTRIGGIVANIKGSHIISNCNYIGKMNVSNLNVPVVGGIIGCIDNEFNIAKPPRVTKCSTKIDVRYTPISSTSTAIYCGGIFGETYGKGIYCNEIKTDSTIYSDGETNSSALGGIGGYLDYITSDGSAAYFYNIESTGSIEAQNACKGAFIGRTCNVNSTTFGSVNIQLYNCIFGFKTLDTIGKIACVFADKSDDERNYYPRINMYNVFTQKTGEVFSEAAYINRLNYMPITSRLISKQEVRNKVAGTPATMSLDEVIADANQWVLDNSTADVKYLNWTKDIENNRPKLGSAYTLLDDNPDSYEVTTMVGSGSASRTKTLTLTNTGDQSITNIAMSNSNTSAFSCNIPNTTLAAGESMEIDLVCDKDEAGTFATDATLSFTVGGEEVTHDTYFKVNIIDMSVKLLEGPTISADGSKVSLKLGCSSPTKISGYSVTGTTYNETWNPVGSFPANSNAEMSVNIPINDFKNISVSVTPTSASGISISSVPKLQLENLKITAIPDTTINAYKYTEKSDLQLPSELMVTTNYGTLKMPVTWSPTALDTYDKTLSSQTFTNAGIISLELSTVTNPASLKGTLKIKLETRTFTNDQVLDYPSEPLNEVNIPYNTNMTTLLASDVWIFKTAKIGASLASCTEVPIESWDVSSVDTTQVGSSYTITATMPSLYEGADYSACHPKLKVNIVKAKITSISPTDPIQGLPTYTDISKLGLPEKLNVFYSNGEVKEENIIWTESSYDKTSTAEQVVTGVINGFDTAHYDLVTSIYPSNMVKLSEAMVTRFLTPSSSQTSFETLIDVNADLSAKPSNINAELNALSETGSKVVLSLPVSYDTLSIINDIHAIGTYNYLGTVNYSRYSNLTHTVEVPKLTLEVKPTVADTSSYSTPISKEMRALTNVNTILPETIPVMFSNGLTKNLKVNWDTTMFDSSVIGEHEVTGTFDSSSIPTGYQVPVNNVIAKVKVKAISTGAENITNFPLDPMVNYDVPYDLDPTILAERLKNDYNIAQVRLEENSSETSINITSWDVTGVDTTSLGSTYIVTGTLEDKAGYDLTNCKPTMTVTIVPTKAISLETSELNITDKPAYSHISKLGLPTTTSVTWDNMKITTEVLEWNEEEYSNVITTPQNVTAFLKIADTASYQSTLKSTAHITLKKADVSDISVLPPHTSNLETYVCVPISDEDIPTEVEVELKSYDASGEKVKISLPISYNTTTMSHDIGIVGDYTYTGRIDITGKPILADIVEGTRTLVVGRVVGGRTYIDGPSLHLRVLPRVLQGGSYAEHDHLTALAYADITGLLSTTKTVIDNVGTSFGLPIQWNLDTYDKTKLGTQVIQGSLILPDRFEDYYQSVDDTRVYTDVTVEKANIESIEYNTPSNVAVPYGSTSSSVNAPTEATLVLNARDASNSKVRVTVPISVDITAFDKGDKDVLGTHSYPIQFSSSSLKSIDLSPLSTEKFSITVGELKIVGVEVIPEITVPAYTGVADLGLPEQVTVNLDTGLTTKLPVDWDLSRYSSSSTVSQVIQGTLNVPSGYSVVGDITPSVSVRVVKAEVQDIVQNILSVRRGTPLEDMVIPTEITYRLNALNGGVPVEVQLPVAYDTSSYQPNERGRQSMPGTVTLDNQLINPPTDEVLLQKRALIINVDALTVTSIITPDLNLSGTYGDSVESFTELDNTRVQLALSDGTVYGDTDDEVVTLTWNKDAYRNNVATQTLEATLSTADASIDGLDELRFKANIRLTPTTNRAIIGVHTIPEIKIAKGTNLSDADLTRQVVVDLSDGSEAKLEVSSYNIMAIDTDIVGEYRIPLTINLEGTGITNPRNLPMEIPLKVLDVDHAIKYVKQPAPIVVLPNESVTLPNKVEAYLTDGTLVKVNVSFTPSIVTTSTADVTYYKGTLDATYNNPLDLTVTQEVDVVAQNADNPYITYILPNPVVRKPLGTSFGDLKLNGTTRVRLSDNRWIRVGTSYDSRDYDKDTANLQVLSGSMYLPTGTLNKLNLTACHMVKLYDSTFRNGLEEELKATSLASNYEIAVKYGTRLADIYIPQSVLVYLNDSTAEYIPVTWDTSEYNPKTVGRQVFDGRLIYPDYIQPLADVPKLVIRVLPNNKPGKKKKSDSSYTIKSEPKITTKELEPSSEPEPSPEPEGPTEQEIEEDKQNYLNVYRYIPYTLPYNRKIYWNDILGKVSSVKVTPDIFTKDTVSQVTITSKFMKGTAASDILVLEPYNVNFKDVPNSYWAYNEITELSQRGYSRGTQGDLYNPKQNIAVADTLAFFDRILDNHGKLKMLHDRDFVETILKDKDNWSYYNVASIISKLRTTTIQAVPKIVDYDSNLTREEVAYLLWDILTTYNIQPGTINISYNDLNNLRYPEQVYYCTSLGLYKGDNLNNFNPNQTITRAELAAVLIRLDNLLN